MASAGAAQKLQNQRMPGAEETAQPARRRHQEGQQQDDGEVVALPEVVARRQEKRCRQQEERRVSPLRGIGAPGSGEQPAHGQEGPRHEGQDEEVVHQDLRQTREPRDPHRGNPEPDDQGRVGLDEVDVGAAAVEKLARAVE